MCKSSEAVIPYRKWRSPLDCRRKAYIKIQKHVYIVLRLREALLKTECGFQICTNAKLCWKIRKYSNKNLRIVQNKLECHFIQSVWGKESLEKLIKSRIWISFSFIEWPRINGALEDKHCTESNIVSLSKIDAFFITFHVTY